MRRTILTLTMVLVGVPPAAGQEPELAGQARTALRQAVAFFRTKVATQGGYLWRYSSDLAKREGEGRATATMAWVQPPGTPSVGGAFLEAYELCREKACLEAAIETGHALVKGQLRSGGWDCTIEFDPKRRGRFDYRAEPNPGTSGETTLDDNNTQEALRFLMRLDRALEFKDAAIHQAVVYGLDKLTMVQYPNGAWPQRFRQPPDQNKFPVKPATFPETWSRTWPKTDYRTHYTFNDNAIADVIEALFEAAEIYQQEGYRAAAEKAGGFILLAQLPDPQPGWAQQYDADMHPAWARRFEPPSITGGEAAGVIRTLLRLYQHTGDEKYLEPIPRALNYYRNSVLPDGKLARFYELKTNRPLFFTKDYQLTFSDADVPTHYAFKVGNWVDQIAKEYERVRRAGAPPSRVGRRTRARSVPGLEIQAKLLIESLDARGAWVEKGKLHYHGADDPTDQIIATETFIRNLEVLAAYLAAR